MMQKMPRNDEFDVTGHLMLLNICGYFCVLVNDDLMYFHFVQNSSTNSTESLGSLNTKVS